MAKLLTTLKFGEWLPDLPEHDNPGSPLVQNALWVNGGYTPARDFSSLGAALSARCQGATAATDANGDTHIYAGTGTALMEYTGTGFASRTRLAGAYTAADGQYWKFTEYSSPGFPALLVATDFADNVQSLNVGDGAFADLGGTPPRASAVGAVNQFLMLGNTEEGINGVVPNRVQWCGIGDPSNWAFGTLAAQEAQAGEQFLNAIYGPVTMMVFVFIVANNYVIAPYAQAIFDRSVALPTPPDLWALIKIGLGGYVVGRSAEKCVAAWKG